MCQGVGLFERTRSPEQAEFASFADSKLRAGPGLWEMRRSPGVGVKPVCRDGRWAGRGEERCAPREGKVSQRDAGGGWGGGDE